MPSNLKPTGMYIQTYPDGTQVGVLANGIVVDLKTGRTLVNPLAGYWSGGNATSEGGAPSSSGQTWVDTSGLPPWTPPAGTPTTTIGEATMYDPDPGHTFLEKIWPYATAALGSGAIAGGLGLTGGAGTVGGGAGTAELAGGAAADTLGGVTAAEAAGAGAPWVSGYDLAGGGALGAAGGGGSFIDGLLSNVFGTGAGGGAPTAGSIFKSVLPSLIQAGTSLYAGGKQADAANAAAQQQFLAAQLGRDELARQFNVNQANLQPWLRAGRMGLAQLFPMLGIGYNPVTGEQTARTPDINRILAGDPEYQFQLAEGLKALERSAAARTGTLNPAAVKGLERFSQGLASNTYTNRYNRLASLAGLGQTTANQMGTFGQSYATNQANLLGQQGNAAAAGTIGAANARASGLEGVAGAAGQFYQNQMLADILRRYGQGSQNLAFT